MWGEATKNPGHRLKMGHKYNIRSMLSEVWSAMHRGLRHSACSRLTAVFEDKPICYIAGFCLCDGAGPACQAIVADFVKLLAPKAQQGWLKKSSPTRILNDNGKLVLRFHRLDQVDSVTEADTWIVAACGNLNTLVLSC